MLNAIYIISVEFRNGGLVSCINTMMGLKESEGLEEEDRDNSWPKLDQ